MTDIPISKAVLCFNTAATKEDSEDWCAIATRPVRMPHPGALGHYLMTVGAVFSAWHDMTLKEQKLQLMIELWHAAAFHGVPVAEIHEAALVIPEYRDMLADDCLPKKYWHDRA